MTRPLAEMIGPRGPNERFGGMKEVIGPNPDSRRDATPTSSANAGRAVASGSASGSYQSSLGAAVPVGLFMEIPASETGALP